MKEKFKLKKLKNNPKENKLFMYFSRYWPYLLFIIAGLILYGKTIHFDYNVDDEIVVKQNPVIENGWSGIGEIFTSRYAQTSGNLGELSFDYRPIVKLTFGLEFLFFGHNPKISHFINLLLYILTAFVVYHLLRLILKDWHYSLPVLATLLFMVHPTHTEVVSSLKNRDELLSFLFAIIAWFYVIQYGRKNDVKYIVVALISYLIAYLSKSSAVVFLAIYPVSLYFFTETNGKKILWVTGLITIAIVLAQFGPRLFLSDPIRDWSIVENPLYGEAGLANRITLAALTMLFYLRMLFVPYPMLYYYGFDMMPNAHFANPWVWVSIIIHITLLVVAVRGMKSKNIWSFLILFYFIALAPFSNLLVPSPGIVAVRFMYAASLAYSVAVVYLVYQLSKVDIKSTHLSLSRLAIPLAVISVMALAYTVHTQLRNRAWRNIDSLYGTDISRLSNSAKANAQYADFIMNRLFTTPRFTLDDPALNFRTNQMIGHYRRAIDIYPDYFIALNNLGTVYMRLKPNPDSALYFLNRAAEVMPDNETAFINMGSLYRNQGQYPEAIAAFEKVLEINPSRIRALAEIAYINSLMGNHELAQQIYDEVLRIDPGSELPFLYRGNYYYHQGNIDLAVHFWQIAVERRIHVPTCIRLAEYYADRRDFERANYYYELAQRGRPEL